VYILIVKVNINLTGTFYVLLQSEDSEDEESVGGTASGPTSLNEGLGVHQEGTDEATRRLLRRKEQLESRKATLERQRERMQVRSLSFTLTYKNNVV
jgi:hypothetical protein